MTVPSRLWKVLRALGQGLAIVLIGLGLTELAFRALHSVHPIFIFPAATYNRFLPPPHAVSHGFTHNSGGFKDVEYPQRKPAGSFRIVALGDSFAYGIVPYQHNFLTLLEDDLNRSAALGENAPVEVINLGIPAIDSSQYLEVLVNEGLRYDPDLVLVNFFIGNDFRISRADTEPASFVLALLRYLLRIRPEFEGKMSADRQYDDEAATFTGGGYRDVLMRKILQFRRVKPALPHFPRVAEIFAQIRQLCEGWHARLYVVLIPDEVQVDPEVRRWFFTGFRKHRMKEFDFALPNKKLHAELERQGISHLDLLGAFRAGHKETALYRPRDSHWNIAGNRLAAREIAAALRAGGWVPSSDSRQGLR